MISTDGLTDEFKSGERYQNYLFRRKKLADLLVALTAVLMLLGYCAAIIFVFGVAESDDYAISRLFFGQARVTIGMPAGAALAFFVVWIFEVSSGDIEAKATVTFAFKGGSTPILFWILCYVSICSMIWLNWAN